MPDERLAQRNFRFLRLGLLPNGVLEGDELVFRHCNEEGFEQYGGFPEASVDIVVIRVDRVPNGSRIGRRALRQASGGKAKVLLEIRDNIVESIDFVDELETVGQEDPIEKGAHASGALAFGSAEIARIQRGRVRHSAVMFCMLSQRLEKARERLGE